MKTLQFGNLIIRSSLRSGFILTLLALACFGLSPAARAVLPPPDGGYPVRNTAEGEDALFSLTTGFNDTAVGFQALFSNTTGGGNTAIGARVLSSNTTGIGNTATGSNALRSNVDGIENTAIGIQALFSNTTGPFNTALGGVALENNTTGGANTATGDEALENNTTGDQNTATGLDALNSNTTGFYNTANGAFALLSNITGTRNTAFGRAALQSSTSGSRNIALGHFAGSNLITGDNNIDIGNEGVAAESGTIRIGADGTHTATFIAGVSGAGVIGSAVKVNAAGQLGTAPSSERFKDGIKPMDKASEAILALKPVTFHYKKELDPERTPQFGLVAEDVEKVSSALVARDADGKVYTVRYEAVNAMLLNEFLKEHRTVQELKSTVAKQAALIAQQQKEMETIVARLKEQDSKIQRVSAQVEMSKFATRRIRRGGPAPRMVLNR